MDLQIEGQKAQQVQAQQEVAVLSKVEKIRIDQTQRAQALEREASVEEIKVCSCHWMIQPCQNPKSYILNPKP